MDLIEFFENLRFDRPDVPPPRFSLLNGFGFPWQPVLSLSAPNGFLQIRRYRGGERFAETFEKSGHMTITFLKFLFG